MGGMYEVKELSPVHLSIYNYLCSFSILKRKGSVWVAKASPRYLFCPCFWRARSKDRPLLWSCQGFFSPIICSPKYYCYSLGSLGITSLTEYLNIYKKRDEVVSQESPQKPSEGHRPSIEKAEWEQQSHTKGLQQPQSTGESWEPFSRATGLPGSEQGAPQLPMQPGDTLRATGGFLPVLWVKLTCEAWHLTGTWLKCFQHTTGSVKRCGVQML